MAGAVAFDEEGANAESAGDFVSDDYAAESGRDDASEFMIAKNFSEGAAQGIGVLRELQHERALDVGAAVAAAREFEVALADGAYFFEEFEDVVAFHGARWRGALRAFGAPVRVA